MSRPTDNSNNIEVIGVIDLNLLCYDLEKLHQELLSLRRESYTPTQRIVVQYTETDYFYYNNPTGFDLHNFLTLLYSVDISLSQITFVTTHNRLAESIRPFICHEKDIPEIHVVLVSRMTYRNIKNLIDNTTILEKDLKHVGLCMLGTVREHRLRLYQYLKHNNLLDKIQTSVNNNSYNILSPRLLNPTVIDPKSYLAQLGLVSSLPHRTKETWTKPIVNKEFFEFNDVEIDYVNNLNISGSGYDFYRHFAVDIITESSFDCFSQFVSEKTLRSLLLKTPFVVFGPTGFLKYLQSRGFETFSDLWNEDYDSIQHPQDRFVACCHVVKDIAQRPLTYWNKVYQTVGYRLDHNREILLKYLEDEFYPIHSKYQL